MFIVGIGLQLPHSPVLVNVVFCLNMATCSPYRSIVHKLATNTGSLLGDRQTTVVTQSKLITRQNSSQLRSCPLPFLFAMQLYVSQAFSPDLPIPRTIREVAHGRQAAPEPQKGKTVFVYYYSTVLIAG